MKNTMPQNYILFSKIVFLNLIFILLFLLQSCEKKFKENITSTPSTEELNTSIEFTLLSRLNENNSKIIEISDLILNQAELEFPNSLILKIKNDHTRIKSQLIKLKEDNLIITPKPIYDLDLNAVVIKNDTNGKFTISLLENTISNEISDLHLIEKKFTKEEFKSFAKQTIQLLKENQKKLSQIEIN